MNIKHHSSFILHPSSFWILLLALFAATPRAPAQTNWGNALSFNGMNNYVRATIPALANNYTFSAWVYLRAGGTLNFPAGVLSATNCNSSAEVQIGSQTDSPTDPQYLMLGRCIGYYGQPSTIPVPLNQWVHIALTVSSTKQANYFINGSPVGSQNYSGYDTTIGPNITLGDNSYRRFNGMLDEVQIWNKVRSQTEIQESLGRPLTGTEPNLVAYYRFNDGAGSVALDATANHRNGTLVNGPAWTYSTIPLININAGLPGLWGSSAAWGDYDNDGRLDVLLTGFTGSGGFAGYTAGVWRNTGSGFVNINAGLPGVFGGSAAWGDYDNDGRLDILLWGRTEPGQVCQLWRNTGSGFTNVTATIAPGLPAIDEGSVAWGDYDNDGRSDILLTGLSSAGSIAQVWRNTASGFTNINAGLPGVSYGSAVWGDYDNDGRLDILLAGTSSAGPKIAQVWRNTGSGFANVTATVAPGLPGTHLSSVAWGDYDNDGRLDILTSGITNTWDSRIVQVWRNTGSSFTNINAGLPGVCMGSVAWGDYDNDGRLDILLMGASDKLITQVWRNMGSGFTNINLGLPGTYQGNAAWGDYDNDGRLDILLVGDSQGGPTVPTAQIWRNLGAQANTPPTAPTDLATSVVGRDLILSWTAGNDAQIPASGLNYNLRVGTAPGACNIVAPSANLSDGFRRLPARGNLQPGVPARLRDLPWGIYYWSVQAVDTAFAGSPFAPEVRYAFFLPEADTADASNVTCTAATLRGTVNPREHETTAWFEYGLDARYGRATGTANLGSGTNTVACTLTANGLLPWMTYHYRAVASNCVGITVGPDAIVTLPAPPSLGEPMLWGLTDVILGQGGSTSSEFHVSPPEVEVRVRCSNPLLLPAAGLIPGGSGSIRHLTIVPAAIHSGSAQVTVTATDGSRSASQTFNVTVTPSAQYRSPLLSLTNAQVASAHTWRFHVADAGTGYTNYAVEYRSSLAPTNAWIAATNVLRLPGGVFEVTNGPPQPRLGFYRARGTGFRLLMAGFDSQGVTVEEGAGAAGPVLVFNGLYTGNLTCIWTDQRGTNWTTQVAVNGTTAVIPVPASWLTDNTTLSQLRSLTLQLQAGAGFALGATTQSTVTIEENDANWQGVLQTVNGNLEFTLSLVQTNGQLQGLMQSASPGFFPTNVPAQLNFTENAFTLVATSLAMPVLTDSAALRFTNYLDLRLDAANVPGQTNVSPAQIQGVATLVSKTPNRAYLDAAVYGTFDLLRPPTPPSTNDVPLYPAAP